MEITSSVSPLAHDFGVETGGLAVQGRACAVQPGRLHRWWVLDVGPRVVLGVMLVGRAFRPPPGLFGPGLDWCLLARR